MNRILFEPDEIGPDCRCTFGGVRAEHVRAILHGTVGQSLKTGVVGGAVGTSVIEAVTPESVTVLCRHDRAALPAWCDLMLAPPRPRVLKRLLPQLATLGIGRLHLVGAAKVEKAFWGAQLLKPALYRPLLIEGLMQGAVATALPEIVQIRNFARWMEDGFEASFAGQDFRIAAHPQTAAENENDPAVSTAPNSRPVFAVGPEGGWTDAETALLSAHGFRLCTLGPRILKTETAVVALLSRFMPLR